MVDDTRKRTAQAIVNIFETGSVQGDYGQVTLLPGDAGHLTYGRAQTTLASGNLYLLIKSYAEAPQAQFAARLSPYLPSLEVRDLSLDSDAELREALRAAGKDPIMHAVQDRFFDRVYWEPAQRSAATIEVEAPLGIAVVYDSHIHGSWPRMRDRTIERHGTVRASGEREWIRSYVDTRRDWLATHSNELLRRTVYRMDSFKQLFTDGAWDLALPLKVRGVTIDAAAISDSPPLRVSADESFERMLRLKEPRMSGEDVNDLQQLLVAAGFATEIDGVFGPATEAAVKSFQESRQLSPDGIVGAATRSVLALTSA